MSPEKGYEAGDMAPSEVALGRVLHAKEAGKQISTGWGVDNEGRPFLAYVYDA